MEEELVRPGELQEDRSECEEGPERGGLGLIASQPSQLHLLSTFLVSQDCYFFVRS